MPKNVTQIVVNPRDLAGNVDEEEEEEIGEY